MTDQQTKNYAKRKKASHNCFVVVECCKKFPRKKSLTCCSNVSSIKCIICNKNKFIKI